ncbi:MAG: hypothetical protein K940chlam7_01949 [Chlamydiae bacterium]|nr:hypothetical protein [Chlamydiota bacterium]
MSEQLVVVSKIKKYIKAKAGMNTSSTAFEELTKIVEFEIEKAIKSAENENRKTVMDRDFNHDREF